MRAFGIARSRCLRVAAAASSANITSVHVPVASRNAGLLIRPRAAATGTTTAIHVHAPVFATATTRSLSTAAFVSSHFQLDDPHEIPEFLERKRMAFRATDTHMIVKECPFCHPTRGRTDNLFKLYVHRAKGVYKCHRCGAAGSWFDFKQKLQTGVSVGSAGGMIGGGDMPALAAETKVITVLDNAKAMAIQRNLLDDPAFEAVRTYLTDVRGIDERVLTKYGVGAIEQPFRGDDGQQVVAKCISFPWMARQEDMDAMGVVRSDGSPASADKNQFDVIRLKLRGLENKTQQRLVPKGGSWGLFGWNTVPTSADEIVVTEGEFDAMAVYQATGLPAVSLPNGCQSLPPNVLPLLERFKKIYLWMDNDAAGQANVEKFAAKLGITRSYIVRAPTDPSATAHRIKDANDALLAGADLQTLLARAEIIPHSQIATFEELRRDVYDEIVNPIRACGVQSRTLPSLNRLLKGHRPGEVTILTGPTGCGKTTLLSQLSLDLCGQGVNTLWGSFEIKNTRLIQKMLTQLAGKSLRGDVSAFEVVADKFEALPMYFLRFFGSTDVDEVLDAMEYAVYAYDVQHILLDNVQFMMAGQGRGYDKFERQDQALDKFRKFATQKNVHLTLVIHPRKEQEDVDLTLTSVFGTAKATQEADNVLILQRTKGQNKLDVRKNRFDGTLGSIPLLFDADANALKELGEQTMDENVASIHLEAEMRLEQKMRQQKMERAASAAAATASNSTGLNEHESVVVTPPRRFEYSNAYDEFNGETSETRVLYSLKAADSEGSAPKVNGAVHGLNGLKGLHHRNGLNGATDKPQGPASSGSTGASPVAGSTPSRGPNGVNGAPRSGPTARGGGPGTEPFSAFTPIITR